MTRPMNVALYRPHANIWFRNPVRNILRKSLLPNKYAGLLDHLLASGHPVGLTTALHVGMGPKAWLKALIDPLELILWCWLNRIPWRHVRFVFSKGALAREDVLLALYYANFTHESDAVARELGDLARALSDCPVCKVVHMTHYVYNPTLGADHLGQLKPDLLVAETNLAAHSGFFARHFAALQARFEVLPYTPQKRFVNRKPYAQRLNKLVVSGSITYKMRDPEFIGFYGVDELQPLRRALYERAAEFRAEMDCEISDLNASRAPPRAAGRWRRLRERLAGQHPQLGYYRKDIVATYNEHRMFAVPEEICDLPAIGFVEGMACGAAYFGLDSPMYRDIGMLPGVHYVAYDGTVEGLMTKVRHYQADGAALAAIAQRGEAFVREQLNPDAVYGAFLQLVATAVHEKRGRHD